MSSGAHAPRRRPFQFTPLREGRLQGTPRKRRSFPFQFTPLREGRRARKARRHATARFQFTPLREGRRAMRGDSGTSDDISIHAPPRGATEENTRILQERRISIHAPPRGATLKLTDGREAGTPISIHAPPRGATDSFKCAVHDVLYFNSRPSARGDRGCGQGDGCRCISIHAPPRGATTFNMAKYAQSQISIHAPPRGATPCVGRSCSSHLYFNSRPSARGDMPETVAKSVRDYFNSRPSARGDQGYAAVLQQMNISIHAPPRGATAKDMQFLQIFCSTLTNQHGLTIVPRNLSRLFW